MFVTKKGLRRELERIHSVIDFAHDRAVNDAKWAVEKEDISPILKVLEKLEARIEKLEKRN